jgi:hypothetical protein
VLIVPGDWRAATVGWVSPYFVAASLLIKAHAEAAQASL